MKLHRLVMGFFLLTACETAGSNPATTGGTTASGGTTSTGGARTGGTTGSPGTTTSGGSTTSAAGTTTSGGSTTASGGTTTSGGSTAASGGTTTSGGSTAASGGTTASGGSTAASGGTTTSGGNTTISGGSTSTGGSRTGGTTGSGGTTNSGGTAASGGTTTSGGNTTSTGGSTSTGGARTGGTTGSGGTTGTGGTTATGGRTGTGGSTSSGGSTVTGGTTGTGGSTGSGGSTGAGGSGSLCKFASGLNVAWVSFSGDVPLRPDTIATFNVIFKNTYDNGGRIVRWWFHTNGAVTPGYGSNGMAQAIPQTHIDGLKSILGAAYAAKIGLVISLWSFDMLQANATCTGNASTTSTVCKNNHALLEQDANRQAYVDNYLTPLVKALKGTPGLYAYEIFNEAEGMLENGPNGAQPWGWATERTTKVAVQKCVNWFAAAIHAADPAVPVTTGAQTFDYCSNGIAGKSNYYSDSALQAVGGKPTGTLDFYQVHYYAANGPSLSCYTYPKSHWGLTDKALLVMGEFYAADTDGVKAADTYTSIYSGGYDGAWGWSYTEGNSVYAWPSMQPPMKNLFTAHSDVGSCP